MIWARDGLEDNQFDAARVRVGILTALPEEYLAMRSIMHATVDSSATQDPHQYCSGWFRSKDPEKPHCAVIALPAREGTRFAAAATTDMLRSFPDIRVVIMCGIGGGVPAPANPRRDVRLGDIVVATEGIIDYDHVRQVDGTTEHRRIVSGISAALLRADRALRIRELGGEEPWLAHIHEVAASNPRFQRPLVDSDPLHGLRAEQSGSSVTAPRPGVWRGKIGSADTLLRDARRRDRLAAKYGLLAFEMEGVGVATAVGAHDLHWFQVRGICDYCDNETKNDLWHDYAALVAASYVKSLLAECPPFGQAQPGGISPVGNIQVVVDSLLALPQLSDDYHRRAVLSFLPGDIRDAVPSSVTARIHVVQLVRTCERTPGGRDALLEALRLALGESSPDFRRTEAVFLRHWSGL